MSVDGAIPSWLHVDRHEFHFQRFIVGKLSATFPLQLQ